MYVCVCVPLGIWGKAAACAQCALLGTRISREVMAFVAKDWLGEDFETASGTTIKLPAKMQAGLSDERSAGFAKHSHACLRGPSSACQGCEFLVGTWLAQSSRRHK